MHFLRALIPLAVSAAALLAAGRSSGQGEAARTPRAPLPVDVAVTTTGACSAGRFRQELDARVRRPFEAREGATTSLRIVVVASTGSALEGTAYFAGTSGKDSRAIRGSCDEITRALALVASTWLEAEPEPATAPPATAPPATAPPATAPPATAPPAPAPPAPDVPRPAPSAPAKAASVSDAAGSSPPPPRRRFALGAHGVVSVGLVGGPAAGGGVAIAFAPEPLELRGGVRVAFGGETVTAGSARYTWVTVPIDGCARIPTGAISPLSACARVEPGVFDARFGGSSRLLAWLGVGAGLRLGWARPSFRIELEAFGISPATGYRISPTDATLAPFRAVSPAFAAGIMVPFS